MAPRSSEDGSGVHGAAPDPQHLTILYDETCGFCRRARDWLLSQRCLVPVELLPAGSVDAQQRFSSIPDLHFQLVVADDDGNVWVGPPAFVMCLWATARYRALSYRLSGRHTSLIADRFFSLISERRDVLSRMLGRNDTDCIECKTGRPSVGAG
jgi:predicted DCC family thiol-disulfide oxidoreductase YuxK